MDAVTAAIAFVFPGQGSQFVGMGRDLAAVYPTAAAVFQQADEILGYPLTQLAWDGPAETLGQTLHTQPALLTHSVAALRVLAELRPAWQPHAVAGHSMGEVSALVAAAALPFADALRLARRRGEVMQAAGETHPGGMAAVLNLDIPTLTTICAQAAAPDEPLQVANDNCPGQVVISGAAAALARAIPLAQAAGARRVMPLAVSIASHSPLMAAAQTEFAAAVAAAPLNDPHVPVIGNVSAAPLTSAAALREDLRAQLTSPVRWTESIAYLLGQGVTTFIELGSGSVLAGLIKRIAPKSDPAVTIYSLGTPADFANLPA
jgi:[acyl-carrier-protein] S-malonyltransferase